MMTHTPYPSITGIIRTFAPGWFASIMGTGMLAILFLALSTEYPALKYVANIFYFLNLALFAVLFSAWLLRWFLYPSEAWATMKHPIQGNFYATPPIALLVLAAQGLAFGGNLFLVQLAWWAGVLLTYLFSFAILYPIFTGESVQPEHITPAQFMPAVGLVVIPVAGGPLLAHMTDTIKEVALLLNMFGLGAGSLLYIGLFSLMIHRNYLHKPTTGILTPTLWIQVSPICIIPVSLMNLLPHLNLSSGTEAGTSKIFALLCLGAALWWLLMCIIITTTAWCKKQLPFALTWWAFIFPLGALANLCLRLFSETHLQTIYIIGVVVIALMTLLWSVTFFKTFLAVFNGSIFAAPK